ncbi:EspA/EspE family type VII secretion system effector [Mycolicibacterium wolinskyi]|uniref:TPR repeat region-containing protein n=1 Tax=Mycolicibacterium wolinskyi TaxID=59750 RepID=UPI0039177200
MSALDGFYSTWNKARETFGQGTPDDGTQFDGSSRLMEMKANVDAAAPDDRWQGSGSQAYAAANKEHAAVYEKLAELDKKMAGEVKKAADVVTVGRINLDTSKGWVESMVNSLPAGLSDTDRENKLIPIAKAGITKVDDIVKSATDDMTTIKGNVDKLKGEYETLTKQKFGPGTERPDENKDGKPDSIFGIEDDPEARKRAEEDVRNALAGDQEAAGRVESVLDSLSPEQRSGAEDLSSEQGSYVSQLNAQMKGMSVEELHRAEQRLGDHKDIIGDSWQLMSSDDIWFPTTETEVGALDDPAHRTKGGFDQLPTSVQDAIRNADSVWHTEEGNHLFNAGELSKISEIVQDGDKSLQTGTELDRELIRAADRIMDSDASAPAPVVQDIFDAVGRDHQIVHDHVVYGDDPDDFLNDVNRMEWTDNGTAAGSLFSWTNESHAGTEETIAAATAEKYAAYIGNHKDPLMDINGQTVGQLNPELVQAYAHGLAPYVPDIAGLSNAEKGDPFGPIENEGAAERSVAKGIYSVLATDKDAYAEFKGATNANVMALSQSWAADAKDGTVPEFDKRLSDCATLMALDSVGTTEAVNRLHLNAQELYDQKKAAYEIGLKMLAGVGGAAPAVGPGLGPSVDVVGTAMENMFLGPEPKDGYAPATVTPMFAEDPARLALNALYAQGAQVQGIPDNWLVDVPVDPNNPDGPTVKQVQTFDALNRAYEVSHGDMQQDLNEVLNTIVGEDDNPTIAMILQYNGIAENAVPNS